MKLVRTGKTANELVEVYATTHCHQCGRPLKAPNVGLGSVACAEHKSHRTLLCKTCRIVHLDDHCAQALAQNPHVVAPPQHGPTAEFGDG